MHGLIVDSSTCDLAQALYQAEVKKVQELSTLDMGPKLSLTVHRCRHPAIACCACLYCSAAVTITARVLLAFRLRASAKSNHCQI